MYHFNNPSASNVSDEPSKAEFLASLITGNASLGQHTATIQRSHRFPAHLFWQIENMARMGGVPISLIINQVLECGLDAVIKELPEEAACEVTKISPAQLSEPMGNESIDIKQKSKPAKPRAAKLK